MPFVIFRARSRERSQLPLPGRFLSRLCITNLQRKFKLEYCKTVHRPLLLRLQEFRGKGDGGWNQVSLQRFPADKIASAWTKCFFWQPIARTTSSCLLPDTLTMRLQKCLYSWQCKLRELTVTAFHCKESTHRK